MGDKLVDQIGQFTTIPNTVIRMWPVIGTDAFVLFVCLRYHSDDKGESFPAYPKITEETGLSRNRIARAIRALEKNNLLTRKKRFSGSTIYTLVMPMPVVPKRDDCDTAIRH
jgi:biotin operon repressor